MRKCAEMRLGDGRRATLRAQKLLQRSICSDFPTSVSSSPGTYSGYNGDAAPRAYLRRFYSVREELPTHYDLVVNTDTFTVEQAAGLVVQAAGRNA
jgi:hypothetical protein